MMKIRSFLAFDIPEKVKSELGSVIAMLQSKVKGVRWMNPERMHCTLRFFGNVEEELLLGEMSKMIDREVLHQSTFRLVGHGIGVFPNWRYPRVLWAGLTGETDAVISLHGKMEAAFEQFGLERDPRLLRLHLTLGRSKSPFKDRGALMSLIEKMAEREFGEFEVTELVLYQSELRREGAIYTPLRRFALGRHADTSS